ncbi:BON domain-containing protein [Fulvivirga kasyanovii]|uniref:BON domain-containing protein n=1 Tax=Fulvivirga kasyanovii TaxID=396812 RepID=A0ABW9RR15_9BACT|nr:BON domain-containing protein [Fulvivirga kasyanovii]MTI26627.1 BON domain-containing protein [Fulvivirga kasyanovii]
MKTDEQIRKDVIEEIRWDPQISDIAPHIGVSVDNGVVTLSGTVEFYTQKLAAEKAAQRVSGVKVVAVDIELKGQNKDVTDAQLGEAIRNALAWHSAVNEDRLEIKVDNGWVYLSGTVKWDYERKAAERSIEKIIGVKGIINRVKVENEIVEPKHIKRKISEAFHRHASVDVENITVDVNGSTVTLRGKVSSWAEREDAEDVAWAMPGVTEVANNLVIDTSIYAEH